MSSVHRPLADIHDDLLQACVGIASLAGHLAEYGPEHAPVLARLENAVAGFQRLMVERRALEATAEGRSAAGERVHWRKR